MPKITKKQTQGKLRYDLLPFSSVDKLVEVLTKGTEKYGPSDWKEDNHNMEAYKGALLRHISKYMQEDKFDEETGLSHLAHAGVNILFLLHFEEQLKNTGEQK